MREIIYVNINALRRAVLCALIFTALFCPRVKGRSADDVGGVRGEVTINFRDERLSAKLKYDYVATQDNEATITFFLNRAFDVKNVSCRLCRSFNFDRQATPNPSLIINLKESLPKGRRLNVEIEYGGSLKDIYNQESNFLELGLDNFWYPVDGNTVAYKFLYRISVRADEPTFQLVSNGRVSRGKEGWLVESRVPDFDIDLVMADGLKFKSYRRGGYDLQVVSQSFAEEASGALLATLKEILDFYNSSFGASDPQLRVTAVLRPPAPGRDQGGYSRKGYFVYTPTGNAQELEFAAAHELAHYWWLKAERRNSWLNESFAEYSAMLFLREHGDSELYRRLLEEKRVRSANLPPVYGFDRDKDRRDAHGVLYSKGVVKLNELESELGERKFMDFLRRVADAGVRDTDTLIEVLARVTSREVADRFLLKLKE